MFLVRTLEIASCILLRCKGKGKVVPMLWHHAMNTYGEMDVYLQVLLTWTYMDVSDQIHASAASHPGKQSLVPVV
jgi:hypothetical protein